MKKFLIILGFISFINIISYSYADIDIILEGQKNPITISTKNNNMMDVLINTAKNKIENSVSILGITNSGIQTCSGTIIKNTKTESIILTAKHCIGFLKELYVENILVKSTGTSLYDDLAYIKLNKQIPNKKAVIISEFAPKKNDSIIIVGYPNMKLYIALGEITYKTNDWQFTNIKVKPGVSGAGVYNEYGELIGIVWGAIDKSDNTSSTGIFERYEDIIKFIQDNKLL